jgi:hypothetical protein
MRVIDGQLHRVYKNLFPSLRVFWLQMSQQYADATYIVYGDQRLTYREAFEKSLKAAAMFQDVYGVRKGTWGEHLYSEIDLLKLVHLSRRSSRYMFSQLSGIYHRFLRLP